MSVDSTGRSWFLPLSKPKRPNHFPIYRAPIQKRIQVPLEKKFSIFMHSRVSSTTNVTGFLPGGLLARTITSTVVETYAPESSPVRPGTKFPKSNHPAKYRISKSEISSPSVRKLPPPHTLPPSFHHPASPTVLPRTFAVFAQTFLARQPSKQSEFQAVHQTKLCFQKSPCQTRSICPSPPEEHCHSATPSSRFQHFAYCQGTSFHAFIISFQYHPYKKIHRSFQQVSHQLHLNPSIISSPFLHTRKDPKV